MHRLLTLLLASLLSACLYIPVKQSKVTGGSAPTADDLAFLSTPGLRFEDLEAKLGMPGINFIDIGVVVYSWQMRAGFLIWGVASAGGGGGGGAGSVDQTHDLLIAYGADGRVLAHAVEKRRLVGQDAYEHASRWRAGLGIAPMAPSGAGPDNLVDILVFVPTNACMGRIWPFELSMDGRAVAEIKRKGVTLTRAAPGRHILHVKPRDFCAACNPQLRYAATPLELIVEAGKPSHLRLCHAVTREGSWRSGREVLTQRLEMVERDAMDAELPGQGQR